MKECNMGTISYTAIIQICLNKTILKNYIVIWTQFLSRTINQIFLTKNTTWSQYLQLG